MLNRLQDGILSRAFMAIGWAAVGAIGAIAASVYPALHQAFCGVM